MIVDFVGGREFSKGPRTGRATHEKKNRKAALANVWELRQVWRNSLLFHRTRLGMRPEQSTIIGLAPSD